MTLIGSARDDSSSKLFRQKVEVRIGRVRCCTILHDAPDAYDANIEIVNRLYDVLLWMDDKILLHPIDICGRDDARFWLFQSPGGYSTLLELLDQTRISVGLGDIAI